MIESRLVLEKIKILESKMRYQIEKLVRVAEDSTENALDGTCTVFPRYGAISHNSSQTLWPSDRILRRL